MIIIVTSLINNSVYIIIVHKTKYSYPFKKYLQLKTKKKYLILLTQCQFNIVSIRRHKSAYFLFNVNKIYD
jgi:hypothetical protein